MNKYIVFWTKEGESRWDILNKNILFDFLSLNKLLDNENTIIFGPDIEYKTVPQLVEKGLSMP